MVNSGYCSNTIEDDYDSDGRKLSVTYKYNGKELDRYAKDGWRKDEINFL